MQFRKQRLFLRSREQWYGTALGRQTPNLLDRVGPAKTISPKYTWMVGLLCFFAFGGAIYGGLQWIQGRYFQGSHVLGETTQAPESGIKNQEFGIKEHVESFVGLAALGVRAAPYVEFLNQLLGGKDSVKTYLLVFQNYSEIRPTGGFMGSYAWVRIVGGKQISYGIPGGGFYDLTGSRSVLVEAPKPFQIFSPMEQIWNANWYPDFPTSAKRIGWFYVNSGQDSVDGIITVTPKLLEEFLLLTGPIELPEFNKTISAENAYRELQFHVEFEYDKIKNQPKEIISVLVPKLMDRLAALSQSEYPKVIGAIADLLDHKQIVAYVGDSEAQAFVQSRGWDGRMLEYSNKALQRTYTDTKTLTEGHDENVGNDYISIIHTNVGGGKTDLVVRTQESIEKTILPDGSIRTVVTVIRSHQGDPADPLEGLTNIDYVRIYAPEGARYMDSQGFGELPKELYKDFESHTPAEPAERTMIERDALVIESDHTRVVREVYPELVNVPERRYTSFGNWIIVKPGESVVARMTFDQPSLLTFDQSGSIQKFFKTLVFRKRNLVYGLVWQKQAGMDEVDQTFRLFTPNGVSTYISGVTPSIENDHELAWNAISSQDHFFVVGLR